MRRLLLIVGLAAGLACSSETTGTGGLVLDVPAQLEGTSLNGAIYLYWLDNAFENAAEGTFLEYRIYSTSYSLEDQLCGEEWSLEGSTLATEFLAGLMVNGVPRCFTVVSVSVDGLESGFSTPWADTPRPDARNVIMDAYQVDPSFAGFKFWDDLNADRVVDDSELGIVTDGDRTDIDFWLTLENGEFFMVPERAGTGVTYYSLDPIADLTTIDIAPVSGYETSGILAIPMYGYVFQMDEGDTFPRYGAIRVTHVGTQYIIFDWSYQTDPGNPELSVHGGLPVKDVEKLTVRR